MLAAHHRPNNPTGKRLGLPHSHFEKTQLTDLTIYNVQPLKNRRFSSPVAKDGLDALAPKPVHPKFVGCCGTSAAWGHAAYKAKNRGCRPGDPTGCHGTPTTCEYMAPKSRSNPAVDFPLHAVFTRLRSGLGSIFQNLRA